MRKLALVVAVAVTYLFALGTQAHAAVPAAFGGDVACTVQPAIPDPLPGSEYSGQRWCGTGTSSALSRSTVKSFDGTPIDVNFALPPEPVTGSDGPYPVMMIFHGFAMSKTTFQDMQRWLDRGYAVFTMTDRGFHESCGSVASRLADQAGCEKGWIRLLDTRYEVRDAQYLAGMLVDDGLIMPNRIASTGGSYGGGLTMALAALKNRTMLLDGSLVPWKSPDGTGMSLTLGIPSIPWTDLAYSLVPNGNTLDYVEDAPYSGRFGVMKESWVNLLYSLGLTLGEGFYSPAGEDPSSDLTGWKALLDAGEPYDGRPEAEAILDDITTYHSSYYIDHSIAPAPLLIYSGFTDDLFPVGEATRFYNRTRAEYPAAKVGLLFGPNSGHMRGMNKADAREYQQDLENQWVDHYLKGEGAQPPANVHALLQTCPADAPVGDAVVAKDWASISPGEIRVMSPGQQTVSADGGDPVSAGTFNLSQACATAPGAEENGIANYQLDPAPAGGFTVLGAPTVIAKIKQSGDDSQIAARLVDVSPDGLTKLLVARGLWRPQGQGFQVFQLHANGWKVEEGHTLRLELLPKDASAPAGGGANHGRPSNGQTDAVISDLDLRIPVAESPGSLGGLVKSPAKKVLPKRPGVKIAPGYEAIGYLAIDPSLKAGAKGSVRGRMLRISFRCPTSYTNSCPNRNVTIKGAPKKGKGKGVKIAAGTKIKVPGGKTRQVKLKLTGKARRLFRDRGQGRRKVKGLRKLRVAVIVDGKRSGYAQLKRLGKVR